MEEEEREDEEELEETDLDSVPEEVKEEEDLTRCVPQVDGQIHVGIKLSRPLLKTQWKHW